MSVKRTFSISLLFFLGIGLIGCKKAAVSNDEQKGALIASPVKDASLLFDATAMGGKTSKEISKILGKPEKCSKEKTTVVCFYKNGIDFTFSKTTGKSIRFYIEGWYTETDGKILPGLGFYDSPPKQINGNPTSYFWESVNYSMVVFSKDEMRILDVIFSYKNN